MSAGQVARFIFPSETKLRMGIIATIMRHMRNDLITAAKETDREAWNNILEHDLVFYVPSSTASGVAGAIVVHRPKGVDACRWEIKVLALAPGAEDQLAQDLLHGVQEEARKSGRKTLVAFVMGGEEKHFIAAGFRKTAVPEYRLDGNSVPREVCIMYKIESSKDWANVAID